MKYILILILIMVNVSIALELKCTNANFKKTKRINKEIVINFNNAVDEYESACEKQRGYNPNEMSSINKAFDELNEDIEKINKSYKYLKNISNKLEEVAERWLSLSETCTEENKKLTYGYYQDTVGIKKTNFKNRKRELKGRLRTCEKQLNKFAIKLLNQYEDLYLFETSF